MTMNTRQSVHSDNRRIRWFPLFALVVALGSANVGKAGPAEPLLQVVPDSVSLCVIVQNLKGHVGTIADSPFAQWVGTTAFGKKVAAAPELKRLQQVEAFLTNQLEIPPKVLIEDVLGDAIVFAYQAGPVNKPEQEAGVILIKPSKPATLTKLLSRINELQTRSGELRGVSERVHRGQSYTVREKSDGKTEFYIFSDRLFAFSAQEPMIHAVIDRLATAADASKNPSVALVGVRKLDLSEKAFSLVLNPRAFDGELLKKHENTADIRERAFLAQFGKVWKAVDAVALFAHPSKEVELGASALIRREELPPEIEPILFPRDGASVAWGAVPTDAMFAVGGRLEVPVVLAALGSFLPGDGRAELRQAVVTVLGPIFGRDKFPLVIRGLGPDWAAWMAPPGDGSKQWFPRWMATMKLPPRAQADMDVSRSLMQALELGFQLARISYNQSHTDQIDFNEEKQGEVTVKFLTGEKAFAAGLRPSFAVKDGYLVLASSPEVVAAFRARDPSKLAEAPLLRISATRLRDYLVRHREAIPVAAKQPGTELPTDLSHAIDILELFEQIEVRYQAEKSTAKFSFRIRAAKPLSR